jgi:hypothetical protein
LGVLRDIGAMRPTPKVIAFATSPKGLTGLKN